MIRITSGHLRGRKLKTLSSVKTRPTTERLRQAWMNALMPYLQSAAVLDLFAGTGALGIEALSRGASAAVFVEVDPKAMDLIQENIESLGQLGCSEIVRGDALQVLRRFEREKRQFDLLFLDPPYDRGFEEKILQSPEISKVLSPIGLVCVESRYRKEGAFPAPLGFHVKRHERYGDSQLTFYARDSVENGSQENIKDMA